MQPWSDRLLKEYKEGRKQLRNLLKTLDDGVTKDKEDKRIINSAIRDMDFVIEWIETGMFPEKNPLVRTDKYKVYRNSGKFVYGVNGYWDESIGGFISTSAYSDPFKEVEKKIDKELEAKRLDGVSKYDSEP